MSQSYCCDEFQKDGILLLGASARPDLGAVQFAFVGKKLVDLMEQYERIASFGVMVEDASTGRVIEAGCNAHGRRKFRDAEATQPVLAAEGGAFVAAMYVAEEQARNRGLVGDDLLAVREHLR